MKKFTDLRNELNEIHEEADEYDIKTSGGLNSTISGEKAKNTNIVDLLKSKSLRQPNHIWSAFPYSSGKSLESIHYKNGEPYKGKLPDYKF